MKLKPITTARRRLFGSEQTVPDNLRSIMVEVASAQDMPDVIARLIETYIDRRHADERFVDTVRRIGIEPFKERVYATTH